MEKLNKDFAIVNETEKVNEVSMEELKGGLAAAGEDCRIFKCETYTSKGEVGEE